MSAVRFPRADVATKAWYMPLVLCFARRVLLDHRFECGFCVSCQGRMNDPTPFRGEVRDGLRLVMELNAYLRYFSSRHIPRANAQRHSRLERSADRQGQCRVSRTLPGRGSDLGLQRKLHGEAIGADTMREVHSCVFPKVACERARWQIMARQRPTSARVRPNLHRFRTHLVHPGRRTGNYLGTGIEQRNVLRGRISKVARFSGCEAREQMDPRDHEPILPTVESHHCPKLGRPRLFGADAPSMW